MAISKGKLFLLAAGAALLTVGASGAQQGGPAAWPQPDAEALPEGAWKETVLYGRRLITETQALVGPEVADPEMRYSGNNLTCQNCHLGAGTRRFALPLIGVYGAFPTYMARENEVRTLEERINGCFERSMNGRALPGEGREMKAMLAYIQFLSTGIAVGAPTDGRGCVYGFGTTRMLRPCQNSPSWSKGSVSLQHRRMRSMDSCIRARRTATLSSPSPRWVMSFP